ncbi:MAG: DUF3037 domain-containing protein [Bacteroides sp.]|nr:DUF3037 domain-containing protein [Bacteroides sp.]
MQEKHLYEYAVIRIVPRVEREEFLNIGLILFCKRTRYIRMQYTLDHPCVALFIEKADKELILSALTAFEQICYGRKEGGKIVQFEIPERFRWLTAVRSASIQTSRPHTGLTADPDETFEKLYQELVL